MLLGLLNELEMRPAAVSYATNSTAVREFGVESEPPGFEHSLGTQGTFWKSSTYGAGGLDAEGDSEGEGVKEGVALPLEVGRFCGRVTLNHTHVKGAPQVPVVPL